MQKDSAVLLEVSVDGSQLTLLDGRKLTVNAGDSRERELAQLRKHLPARLTVVSSRGAHRQ